MAALMFSSSMSHTPGALWDVSPEPVGEHLFKRVYLRVETSDQLAIWVICLSCSQPELNANENRGQNIAGAKFRTTPLLLAISVVKNN